MPQEGRKPGWPQGSRKLRRARDRSSFYLEVYRLDIVPYGIMSREQTSFLVQVKTAGNRYIDLAQCLTAVNQKQMHQVNSKGKPYCYSVTVRALTLSGSGIPVLTLPNSWIVKNSVTKTSAGWKKQMKDAGFKLKDLSPYARRIRIAFDDAAVNADGTAAQFIEPYTQHSNSDDGALVPVFTSYETDAGSSVDWSRASEYTTLVIPSDAEGTAPMELPAVMLSAATSATTSIFRVIGQYLRSRRVMREDQQPDDSSLDPSNFLVRLFSGAQPETDEIITEAQEFQDVRPYTMELNNSTNFGPEFLTSTSRDIDTVSATTYDAVTVEAPLGLLCMGDVDGSGQTTTTADLFEITVHAIYEM
jgi:hypothetical protein